MPKKSKPRKETSSKKLSNVDFEKKVLELEAKGMTSEKIGLALMQEGIHPKEHGKISKISKGKGLYHPPEIKNIKEKLERLASHKEKHIQDKRAMREYERIFALLRKQKEYHKIA